MEPNRLELMDEWEGWQRVVEALKTCACAIDINEEDRLAAAITMWGELLVALRMTQTAEVRADALEARITKFNRVLARR